MARKHSKPVNLGSLGDLSKLHLSSVPWDEDNVYALGLLGRFEVLMQVPQWAILSAQQTLAVSWRPKGFRDICVHQIHKMFLVLRGGNRRDDKAELFSQIT